MNICHIEVFSARTLRIPTKQWRTFPVILPKCVAPISIAPISKRVVRSRKRHTFWNLCPNNLKIIVDCQLHDHLGKTLLSVTHHRSRAHHQNHLTRDQYNRDDNHEGRLNGSKFCHHVTVGCVQEISPISVKTIVTRIRVKGLARPSQVR
jgi:hypothetical protein